MKTLACFISCVAALNVELTSILPFGPPVSPALQYTGPALAIAVQKANNRYKSLFNISLAVLHKSRTETCEEAASYSTDLLTRHYYRDPEANTCVAVIGHSKHQMMHTCTVNCAQLRSFWLPQAVEDFPFLRSFHAASVLMLKAEKSCRKFRFLF